MLLNPVALLVISDGAHSTLWATPRLQVETGTRGEAKAADTVTFQWETILNFKALAFTWMSKIKVAFIFIIDRYRFVQS